MLTAHFRCCCNDTAPLAQEAENKHLEAFAAANTMIEQQSLELAAARQRELGRQGSSVVNRARIRELEQKVRPGTHGC